MRNYYYQHHLLYNFVVCKEKKLAFKCFQSANKSLEDLNNGRKTLTASSEKHFEESEALKKEYEGEKCFRFQIIIKSLFSKIVHVLSFESQVLWKLIKSMAICFIFNFRLYEGESFF